MVVSINFYRLIDKINKQLMTGLKGNSEFCFPETHECSPRQSRQPNAIHYFVIEMNWTIILIRSNIKALVDLPQLRLPAIAN